MAEAELKQNSDENHEIVSLISVETYEEDLQIQRAIMASIVCSQIIDLDDGEAPPNRFDFKPVKNRYVHGTVGFLEPFGGSSTKDLKHVKPERIIDLENETPSMDFCSSYSSQNKLIVDLEKETPRIHMREKTRDRVSQNTNGECSRTEERQSSNSFCEICTETKLPNEIFKNTSCFHRFCTDCISSHIAAKIQDNLVIVKCPDLQCCENLEPGFCRSILPKEVYERWGDALCESMVLGSQRFYCPFRDCSALLIDERDENSGEIIRESECPNCNRLFCAQCKVPWHSGFKCEEFQKLNENERGGDDLKMMELAKKKEWQRCPKCRFYVERSEGCLFIRCRCGFNFCYRCGNALKQDHYCPFCSRTW